MSGAMDEAVWCKWESEANGCSDGAAGWRDDTRQPIVAVKKFHAARIPILEQVPDREVSR